ncbi:hypothetical protein BJP34_12875 [Moorena producens PAL-8-15-08-1]|uniref:Uncharacterized protein n=1 Tax=Moorena producens PAL-8-15-08-1 TaxID=1458985 RepID=A0A1D8TRI6_9CYAN|nr:hypothetical protein BJP34_12875 [Moorena producens PAL-8-15-08-1]
MVDPPQPPLTKGRVGKVPLIKGDQRGIKSLNKIPNGRSPPAPLNKGGVGKVPLIKGKADSLKNLLPLAFCLLPFALKSSSPK